MKSLFNIISENSSATSIIPIIAIISIITMILLSVFVKKKWIKYGVSVFILLIGLIFFFRGTQSILQKAGLNAIETSIKIITFAIVGFLTSMILDIIGMLSSKNKVRNKVKNK